MKTSDRLNSIVDILYDGQVELSRLHFSLSEGTTRACVEGAHIKVSRVLEDLRREAHELVRWDD